MRRRPPCGQASFRTAGSSPAQRALGLREAHKEGIAMVIPTPWECTQWDVLVPGCALQARLRKRVGREVGEEFLVQSLYFPPQ